MKLLYYPIILILMFGKLAWAGDYTQVIGLVKSINSKSIANVYIYSTVCHGDKQVEVTNPSLLQERLAEKVKLVMQINRSCTKVIIGQNIRGPQ